MAETAIDEIYSNLGKLSAQMYSSLAKNQSDLMQEQLREYHLCAEKKIAKMIALMSNCSSGEKVIHYKKKLQIQHDEFDDMKEDVKYSRYKIYLRGCGNAGKSTLLNALLSLDENTEGSRTGRLPQTFIMEVYSDDIPRGEALVKKIDPVNGKEQFQQMSREDAIKMEDDEESKFAASVSECKKLVEKECENIFNQDSREKIEEDIFRDNLKKTNVREIRWGIEKSLFFKNCILIDTPGLRQELRYTNMIRDVQQYEVDGIIWVINSGSLQKEEVLKAYEEELQEMQSIYKGKKLVAAINMYSDDEDEVYRCNTRSWQRVEKKARKIWCEKYGFDKLICINAKLGYDGTMSNSEKDIDDSNIRELRRIINEMFSERSTETFHNDRLNKIDYFLDSLYRDTDLERKELSEEISCYDKLAEEITALLLNGRSTVNSEKNRLLKRWLIDVKSRINSNSETIDRMADMPSTQRNVFIQNTIVRTEEFEKNVLEMLSECNEKMYERFRREREKIIGEMSSRKDAGYAVRRFDSIHTGLMLSEGANSLKIQYKTNGWDIASDFISDLFGDNDVTRFIGGFLKTIKNVIKSPRDRMYESIEDDLIKWLDQLHMDDLIEQYGSVCEETLNEIMSQEFCTIEEARKLRDGLENFNANKPVMVWQKVGLEELIGGIYYGNNRSAKLPNT